MSFALDSLSSGRPQGFQGGKQGPCRCGAVGFCQVLLTCNLVSWVCFLCSTMTSMVWAGGKCRLLRERSQNTPHGMGWGKCRLLRERSQNTPHQSCILSICPPCRPRPTFPLSSAQFVTDVGCSALRALQAPPALGRCRSGGGCIIVGHVFLQLCPEPCWLNIDCRQTCIRILLSQLPLPPGTQRSELFDRCAGELRCRVRPEWIGLDVLPG